MRINGCCKYCFALLILIFLSCKSNDIKISSNGNLLQNELTENKYIIFLPENYTVELFNAEDFVVYYIYFDETIQGGIYFGNHPSLHLEDSYDEYRKILTLKSELLGKITNWEIYYNGDNYYTEKIIENNKNEGWDNKIHLWIIRNTIDEIKETLNFYSTLKK